MWSHSSLHTSDHVCNHHQVYQSTVKERGEGKTMPPTSESVWEPCSLFSHQHTTAELLQNSAVTGRSITFKVLQTWVRLLVSSFTHHVTLDKLYNLIEAEFLLQLSTEFLSGRWTESWRENLFDVSLTHQKHLWKNWHENLGLFLGNQESLGAARTEGKQGVFWEGNGHWGEQWVGGRLELHPNTDRLPRPNHWRFWGGEWSALLKG